MLNNANQRPADDSIEQLLGSFSPAPVEIDRDRLMFQAGMRAAQAAGELPSLTLGAHALRARLWPVVAMVSTAAAVVLGVIAWQRPERIVVVERPVEQQLVVEEPLPQWPEQVTSPSLPNAIPTFDPVLNYIHRRDLILRDGPDALPAQPIGDNHVARVTPTQRELLKELPGYRQNYQVDSEAWWQSWLIPGDRL